MLKIWLKLPVWMNTLNTAHHRLLIPTVDAGNTAKGIPKPQQNGVSLSVNSPHVS
jgi:hypothetical protein